MVTAKIEDQWKIRESWTRHCTVCSIPSRTRSWAFLPLEVDNLSERGISRVNGHQIGVRSSEWNNSDLAVDVKHSLLAAGRPNGCFQSLGIAQDVVVVKWAALPNCLGCLIHSSDFISFQIMCVPGKACVTHLLRLARKPVGGLALAAVTLVDAGISTKVGAEDAVLPSGRILQLDVQVAVFPVLGRLNSHSGLGNELGVGDGHGGLGVVDYACGGARRATTATVRDRFDFNLMATWAIWVNRRCRDLRSGCSNAQKCGEESNLEEHVQGLDGALDL